MGAVKNAFHDEICERGDYEDGDCPLPPISTATPRQTIILLERAAELLGETGLTVSADIASRAAEIIRQLTREGGLAQAPASNQ